MLNTLSAIRELGLYAENTVLSAQRTDLLNCLRLIIRSMLDSC